MTGDSAKPLRRQELADFLRSRRERIKPDAAGLAGASRRRTPGLRREEVAEIAGVGATWYTWLEQARDIQPSDETLDRLARALRLNEAETEHLYRLAGPASRPRGEVESQESAPNALRRAIDEFISCPAVVLGRRWDVLAANERAYQTFPGLRELPPERLNWVYLVFCGPRAKLNLIDWETNARRVLAEFRLGVAGILDSPWVSELVDELKAKSSEFRAWWEEREVRDHSGAAFQLHSGEVDSGYERLVVTSADGDGLRLVMYMPSAGK